jgi:hypothetical protein
MSEDVVFAMLVLVAIGFLLSRIWSLRRQLRLADQRLGEARAALERACQSMETAAVMVGETRRTITGEFRETWGYERLPPKAVH